MLCRHARVLRFILLVASVTPSCGGAGGGSPVVPSNYEVFVSEAFALSLQPYIPPSWTPLVEFDEPPSGVLGDPGLVFDEYDQIVRAPFGNFFDDGTWWWKAEPRGNVHKLPIRIFDESGRELLYSDVSFDYHAALISPSLPNPIPPEAMTLTALQLGHSQPGQGYPAFLRIESSAYMRAVNFLPAVFGTSFRVATHLAARPGEEFPHVVKIRFVAHDAMTVTFDLLVDGPSFVGALHAVFTPGNPSLLEVVSGSYFARRDIDPTAGDLGMGFAAFSSMVWKTEADTLVDSTDEAHDSDLLRVTFQDSTESTLPLENPSTPGSWSRWSFGGASLKVTAFSLEQQDRNASHYGTYSSAGYELRPSCSITNLSCSIPFQVDLAVQGTRFEGLDNVVANMALTKFVPKAAALTDALTVTFTVTFGSP